MPKLKQWENRRLDKKNFRHCESLLKILHNFWFLFSASFSYRLLTHGSATASFDERTTSTSHGFVVYPRRLVQSSSKDLYIMQSPIALRIRLKSAPFFFLSIKPLFLTFLVSLFRIFQFRSYRFSDPRARRKW